MTREDLKKIAMHYAHDELKDNHAPIEVIVAAAFLNGIDYAEHHPHWISVEDELPTCNVFVLTCDGQGNTNLLMLAGNGGWYDHSVAKHRNITHWMPLPAPPEHIAGVSKKISSSEIPNNQKGGKEC